MTERRNMIRRSELKRAARKSLKAHYLMFIVLFIGLSFFGTDYVASVNFARMQVQKITAGRIAIPEISVTGQLGIRDVYDEIVNDRFAKGKAIADKVNLRYKKEKEGIFARNKGMLAKIVNSVTSGSILVKAVNAANSIIRSTTVVSLLLILMALAFQILWWIFVQNTVTVIAIRIFLEGRIYPNIPFMRLLFLRDTRHWGRVAKTLLYTCFLKILWAFTLVGLVVKHFSYCLVPYIVAENPAVKPREAVELSRKMMCGHKWECFLLELSFVGWRILNIITLGLSDMLYAGAYRLATMSEYYAKLREAELANGENGILNDKYLFEKADASLLHEVYPEAGESVDEAGGNGSVYGNHGLRRFLANYLGIALTVNPQERKWQKEAERKYRISLSKPAYEAMTYPERLSAIGERERTGLFVPEKLHYIRHYSVLSLIIIFFIFSIFGWIWEVSLHLIWDGVFVNRGALMGPWLPIYGFGGLIVLTLLNRFREDPAKEMCSIILISALLEYFTSFFLEKIHGGLRWWDYTGYMLNLHGRICAEGLIVFGIGGMVAVYLVAPRIDDRLRRISGKKLQVVCTVILVLFLADALYSTIWPNVGFGITRQ